MDATNADRKFTLISYCDDFRDHCGDGHGSQLHFEEELTLEETSRRIQERLTAEDACQDWGFLIQLQGGPTLASRGESFRGAEYSGDDQETKDLAAQAEDIFTQARIASEAEKKAAREARAREEAIRRAKYQRQQEQREYERAKNTIKQYESQLK